MDRLARNIGFGRLPELNVSPIAMSAFPLASFKKVLLPAPLAPITAMILSAMFDAILVTKELI